MFHSTSAIINDYRAEVRKLLRPITISKEYATFLFHAPGSGLIATAIFQGVRKYLSFRLSVRVFPIRVGNYLYLLELNSKKDTYLTAEYETEQQGHSELSVTEENYVEEIWICWFLQEQPVEK